MPKGELKVCLAEACAFYEVGKSWATPEHILGPDKYIYPVIVNLAFSCELYLKALMIWRNPDGSFDRGHSLVDLFNGLSDTDRNGIKGLYIPEFSEWGFDGAIKEFNRLFEDWRYAFEVKEDDNECTIYELIRFADSVHKYVEETVRSTCD